MLIARFLPITGILAIAGSMVQKKKLAVTAGVFGEERVNVLKVNLMLDGMME